MATYTYQNTSGQNKTIKASTMTEAFRLGSDADLTKPNKLSSTDPASAAPNPTNNNANIAAFNNVQLQQGTGQKFMLGQGLVPSTPASPIPISTVNSPQAQPIPLPNKPIPTNPSGNVAQGNAQLGLKQNPTTGAWETPTPTPTPDQTFKQKLDEYMNKVGEQPKAGSQVDAYKTSLQETGVDQFQQQKNDITGEINTIQANAEAAKLALVGQGRGIPEYIIGGQTAQIDREAAIKAIPLQVKLSLAQGNLQIAQDRLDTLFKLRSEDIKNDYDYSKMKYDAVRGFVDKDEAVKLAREEKANDRKYEEKKDFLNKQQIVMQNALVQRAPPSIIDAINSATDVNSMLKAAGRYSMDNRDLNLRIQSEKFQETMSQKNYDLNLAKIQSDILSNYQKVNSDAQKAFDDSPEAKNLVTIKGQVDTINKDLSDITGKPLVINGATSNYSDDDWRKISTDNSAVDGIVNAEVRARNPDISRLADGGDPASVQSLADKAAQIKAQYFGGSSAAIKNLKSATRFINNSLESRMTSANTRLENIKQQYPDAQIVTTYRQLNSGISIKDNVQKAIDQGYTADQIIGKLGSDPLLASYIKAALQNGYTALQIQDKLLKT